MCLQEFVSVVLTDAGGARLQAIGAVSWAGDPGLYNRKLVKEVPTSSAPPWFLVWDPKILVCRNVSWYDGSHHQNA